MAHCVTLSAAKGPEPAGMGPFDSPQGDNLGGTEPGRD
jgi:hypothetical protein